MNNKTINNKFAEDHYHEIMDRTHILLTTFTDFIDETDVVQDDKDMRKLTKKIGSNLAELYQMAGRKLFKCNTKEMLPNEKKKTK